MRCMEFHPWFWRCFRSQVACFAENDNFASRFAMNAHASAMQEWAESRAAEPAFADQVYAAAQAAQRAREAARR